MTTTRLYVVSGPDNTKHLVDAATPSQAVRHVTAELFSVWVAKPLEVAELVGAGTKVENATDGEG
jgi:hypothetical protein